jgi:AI-2E family transporter
VTSTSVSRWSLVSWSTLLHTPSSSLALRRRNSPLPDLSLRLQQVSLTSNLGHFLRSIKYSTADRNLAGSHLKLLGPDITVIACCWQVERHFNSETDTVVADMYGVIAIAIAQGFANGSGILGPRDCPRRSLWCAGSAVVSLLPVGGTALLWLPGSIILGAPGHWAKGIILLAWGAGVVGMLATVVQPILLGRPAKRHTLQIFLRLLGGIRAFGLIGLFLGPSLARNARAISYYSRRKSHGWRARTPAR